MGFERIFLRYEKMLPVSRQTLRGIAEQFQHWLKGWSEKWNIPVVKAPKGRRDDFVDPYFKGARPDAVVVILKAREPARIMTAVGDSKANRFARSSMKARSATAVYASGSSPSALSRSMIERCQRSSVE